MNKKSFHMYLGGLKIAAIILVALGSLAIIGVDIALIVGALYTTAKAVAAVSLAACVIILFGALLVYFNSRYIFKDDKLLVVLGYFVDKIEYKDILYLRQNVDTDEVHIIFLNAKTGKEEYLRTSLRRTDINDFISSLREHIPELSVQMFVEDN